MLLLDIHAHIGQPQRADILRLWQCCLSLPQDKAFFEQNQSERFALGWHPWHLAAHWAEREQWWAALRTGAEQSSVLALGETGLDSLIACPMSIQQEALAQHLALANALGKPLILHSVRTQVEILTFLKKAKHQQPFIFHGFNRKDSIAQAIVAAGGQLSFGKALYQASVAAVFQRLPLSAIWLETDEAELDLPQLYERAAALRGISVEELAGLLLERFERLFGRI
jgi:TatD DNase family protein